MFEHIVSEWNIAHNLGTKTTRRSAMMDEKSKEEFEKSWELLKVFFDNQPEQLTVEQIAMVIWDAAWRKAKED